MKIIAGILLLPAVAAAFAYGYAARSVRLRWRAVRRALRLDWIAVHHGPLEIRTPPSWGEIEPGPEGTLILHNRPSRMRVDGDAVWYGSAMELRIRPGSEARPDLARATRCWSRQLGSPRASLTADLHVAFGVTPARVKEARRVLSSMRLNGDPGLIVWPEQQPATTSVALRRVLPPHSSNIARDFESF
jgi:hypothetical protein